MSVPRHIVERVNACIAGKSTDPAFCARHWNDICIIERTRGERAMGERVARMSYVEDGQMKYYSHDADVREAQARIEREQDEAWKRIAAREG